MFGDAVYFEYADCKRCGNPFEKRSWNSEYCDACKKPRHNERMLALYHKKHGGKPRARKAHDWSEYRRFSFYMEKTWQSARCPVCGAHMSNDPCSQHERGLNQLEPDDVETWRPSDIPIAPIEAQGETWQPWK